MTKTGRILKLLCLMSFLLLIAPFYDHCNGQRMKRMEEAPAGEVQFTEKDTILKNTAANLATEVPQQADTLVYEVSFPAKVYSKIDDGDSENAFEIANLEIAFFIDYKVKNLRKDLAEVPANEFIQGLAFHFKNFCFIFIVANTVLILVFSVLKQTRKIYKHTLINLLLLVLAFLAIVFFDGTFDDIRQIKWGYYVFMSLQAIIAIIARKTFREKTTEI